MLTVKLALRSGQRLTSLSAVRMVSSLSEAPVIKSTFDVASQAYKENYSQMRKLVDKLNETTSYVVSGGKGGSVARQRHTEKGKLLARDRIKHLIDPKYVNPVSEVRGFLTLLD